MAALLARHYFPHREAVESWIADQVSRRREVVHIGVHSFTPRLDGQGEAKAGAVLFISFPPVVYCVQRSSGSADRP